MNILKDLLRRAADQLGKKNPVRIEIDRVLARKVGRPAVIDKDDVRARRESGESFSSIAESYGVTESAVRKACSGQ